MLRHAPPQRWTPAAWRQPGRGPQRWRRPFWPAAAGCCAGAAHWLVLRVGGGTQVSGGRTGRQRRQLVVCVTAPGQARWRCAHVLQPAGNTTNAPRATSAQGVSPGVFRTVGTVRPRNWTGLRLCLLGVMVESRGRQATQGVPPARLSHPPASREARTTPVDELHPPRASRGPLHCADVATRVSSRSGRAARPPGDKRPCAARAGRAPRCWWPKGALCASGARALSHMPLLWLSHSCGGPLRPPRLARVH